MGYIQGIEAYSGIFAHNTSILEPSIPFFAIDPDNQTNANNTQCSSAVLIAIKMDVLLSCS